MENSLEVLKSEAIEAQTRAEVDIAIATAKRYPRDMKIAVKQVEELATMNQETAESCFFALPRGGKTIEGESIRFAEIVAQSWGNLKYGTRIIGNDGKKITAQAIVHDLERNIFASVEIDRKITDKFGKMYNEDMIIMTGNAAKSIALRNAILQVVPKGLFQQTVDKIKDVAIGKALDLQKSKEKAIKYFTSLNVKEDEICKILEIKEISDMDKGHITTLRGLVNAIKDGDTTIDEAFGRVKSNANQAKVDIIDNDTDIDICLNDIKLASDIDSLRAVQLQFIHLENELAVINAVAAKEKEFKVKK